MTTAIKLTTYDATIQCTLCVRHKYIDDDSSTNLVGCWRHPIGYIVSYYRGHVLATEW